MDSEEIKKQFRAVYRYLSLLALLCAALAGSSFMAMNVAHVKIKQLEEALINGH